MKRWQYDKKIGIIYCERIQDKSCVGCAKCYKAVNENAYEFEGKKDIGIVSKIEETEETVNVPVKTGTHNY